MCYVGDMYSKLCQGKTRLMATPMAMACVSCGNIVNGRSKRRWLEVLSSKKEISVLYANLSLVKANGRTILV